MSALQRSTGEAGTCRIGPSFPTAGRTQPQRVNASPTQPYPLIQPIAQPFLGMVQVRLTLSQDASWRGGTKWPETIGFTRFSGEKWLF